MKAELKQKWLGALRSGQYQQGTGVLRDKFDRFCCLGVLCDVVNPADWGDVRLVDTCVNSLEIEIDAYPYGCADDTAETTLTCAIQQQAGLLQGQISKLISLNDAGNDFEFIARHIEHNIPAE